jgi:hypothetical protein
MFDCMYVCMYVSNVCLIVCMYVCIYLCMYACMYVCTYAYTNVRMQACHIHTKHTNNMYISTHIHTNIHIQHRESTPLIMLEPPHTHTHTQTYIHTNTHQHTYKHTHTAPGINPAHYVRPLRRFSLRAIQLFRAVIPALSTNSHKSVPYYI